ncbi:MAG: enoyl-CoA hydratase-related protein [Gammaproteobacteria bacterium]|nr:enoyl-CoA hydratase-related protein [Gammaproteobacteria bacterium]
MAKTTEQFEYEEIRYEVDGATAVITLNRPETLNALTDLTQAEVRHALERSEKNPDILGNVLTGEGRGFCSGVDMNALGKMSEAGRRLGNTYGHLAADPGNPDNDPNFEIGAAYFLGLSKPLIAAINGACAGLGFSWATFCDLRFIDRNARITTSFAQRGLIAEHGTSWMLPRLIGPANALDLFWTSRKINGEEAFRLGYANRLCEDGECVNDAISFLNEINETNAPNSLMYMKRQVYKHLNKELHPAMVESNTWMDESLARGDFKEGVDSFVQKRPPQFNRVGSE